MTSDLSTITQGAGPCAARLDLLVERALELYRLGPTTLCAEQYLALTELRELLPQISKAARDTAEAIEAAIGPRS